jgi:drug/metabolite transporter (DMT)-like permease
VDRKLFWSVGLFGCLGNYLIIAGLENVYLAIASLLNNTFPLFVIIVAYFMVGETLTKN